MSESELKAALEAAWRDGFQSARDCLTDDEAFCLTEDVEHDTWLDSKTAALARRPIAQAEVREVLERYGDHDMNCTAYTDPAATTCSCGFDAALAGSIAPGEGGGT